MPLAHRTSPHRRSACGLGQPGKRSDKQEKQSERLGRQGQTSEPCGVTFAPCVWPLRLPGGRESAIHNLCKRLQRLLPFKTSKRSHKGG